MLEGEVSPFAVFCAARHIRQGPSLNGMMDAVERRSPGILRFAETDQMIVLDRLKK